MSKTVSLFMFVWQSNCVDMKFNITNDVSAETTQDGFVDVDFSKLETELRDYIIRQDVRVCV